MMNTTDNEFRRFALQEPLENRAYSPTAKRGLKSVRVFEAGTVIDVLVREIDTGYETFAAEAYSISGKASPPELAADLRKRDPGAKP
jgi:hypothetical protein